MSQSHKTELDNFYDNFAGYNWDYCIRFYKNERCSGHHMMRETGTNTPKYEIGKMMLDLVRRLSKDTNLQKVSKVISHECLRIGLPDRPIFRSPQIWIEWDPSQKSYTVGQTLNKEFDWTHVDANNIVQVLQQSLEQLQHTHKQEG